MLKFGKKMKDAGDAPVIVPGVDAGVVGATKRLWSGKYWTTEDGRPEGLMLGTSGS